MLHYPVMLLTILCCTIWYISVCLTNTTNFGSGFSWTPTELQNGNISHKSQKRYLLSNNINSLLFFKKAALFLLLAWMDWNAFSCASLSCILTCLMSKLCVECLLHVRTWLQLVIRAIKNRFSIEIIKTQC